MKKQYVGYIVISIAVVIVIVITAIIVDKFWWSRNGKESSRDVGRYTEALELIKSVQPPSIDFEEMMASLESMRKTPSLLEKKKQKFLTIAAVSFIYVDSKAITEFYAMTFKEPTVEDMVERLIEKRTGEVESGDIVAPILKSGLGGENLKEYIKTIKFPETTVPEMFLRYQKHLLENDKVRYGFDEIEIKLEETSNFEKQIKGLEGRYGISFSEAIKEAKKKEIQKKLIDKSMAELEKVDQWVLVDGKYRITNENDEVYRLTYEHPINEHLTHLPKSKVQIVCFLDKNLVENRYKAQLEMMAFEGAAISISIFGKVFQPIDRQTNSWKLIITPFAIY